jgi:hypothetical protein
MNFASVLGVVEKLLTYLPVAIAIGKNVKPAINAVVDLIEHAKADTLTEEMIQDTDAKLDALIDRFNQPLVRK